MRIPGPFDRADNLRQNKKGGVSLDTPPDLSAVSTLKRLLQGVDAGAEVDVKGCSIHYERRNRLDTRCFCFFHPRFVRAEVDVFHGIFRGIKGVGNALFGCDAHRASSMIENRLCFHKDLLSYVIILMKLPYLR